MSVLGERMSRMLENDSTGEIKRTLRVAQSDVLALLLEYMNVLRLDIAADRSDEGYLVNIRVAVSRFYSVGNTSDTDEY